MSTFTDYYALLGVSVDATPREIRLAYVRLAKQQHPDVGGSHEEMRLLNTAYGTLVNGTKRVAYDKVHRMETIGLTDAYKTSGGHEADGTGPIDMSDDEIDDFMNAIFAEYANKPVEPPLHKKAASVVRKQLRKRKRK